MIGRTLSPYRLDSAPMKVVSELSGDGSWTETWVDTRRRPHRLDGPARIFYRGDGTVGTRQFLRFGKLHRVDGPADEGVPGAFPARYFYEGRRVVSRGALIDCLDREETAKRRREFRLSSYAVFLDEGFSTPQIIDALRQVTTFEGLRAFFDGAPLEWVRSFESGATA